MIQKKLFTTIFYTLSILSLTSTSHIWAATSQQPKTEQVKKDDISAPAIENQLAITHAAKIVGDEKNTAKLDLSAIPKTDKPLIRFPSYIRKYIDHKHRITEKMRSQTTDFFEDFNVPPLSADEKDDLWTHIEGAIYDEEENPEGEISQEEAQSIKNGVLTELSRLDLLNTLSYVETLLVEKKDLSLKCILKIHEHVTQTCNERNEEIRNRGCLRSDDMRVYRYGVQDSSPKALRDRCNPEEQTTLDGFLRRNAHVAVLDNQIYPELLTKEEQAVWEKIYYFPPKADQIDIQLNELFTKLSTMLGTHHPIEVAAFFNIEWTRIHPFELANGRTAHLARNIILMNAGYPPVTCHADGRSVAELAQAIAQEIMQRYQDHAADIQACVAA